MAASGLSPSGTSASSPAAAPKDDPDAVLDHGPWRRLTQAELAGALAVVLRVDRAATEAAVATLPEDDTNSRGFVVPRTVNDGYIEALSALVARLISPADPARVSPEWARECPPARQGEAPCLESFARKVGRIAYRRPLEAGEVAALVTLAQKVLTGVEGATTADALRAVLSFMLQSPEFLYLWERGPTDREEVVAGRVALSPHERAARLSFFYWSEPPDAELGALADSGALREPTVWRAQAERLFEDPRADRLFRSFMQQWLGLDKVSTLTRAPADDGAVLTPALQDALQEEAAQYLRHVIRRGGASFEALLTSKTALVDRALAAHYGLPRPAVDGVQAVPRQDGGLLALGAVLVAAAGHDAPSPTHFGVVVRDALLCDPLAPPPEDVATNLPPLEPGGTLRARVEAHVAAPACAGCHRFLDPIGFAALAYDHLGRPARPGRPKEDTSGLIVDYEAGVDRPFVNLEDLMRLLGANGRARQCFARQWLRFATGMDLGNDTAVPTSLTTGPAGPGDLRRLVTAVADSDAFRFRRPVTR
jgi:hypothetical protein